MTSEDPVVRARELAAAASQPGRIPHEVLANRALELVPVLCDIIDQKSDLVTKWYEDCLRVVKQRDEQMVRADDLEALNARLTAMLREVTPMMWHIVSDDDECAQMQAKVDALLTEVSVPPETQ